MKRSGKNFRALRAPRHENIATSPKMPLSHRDEVENFFSGNGRGLKKERWTDGLIFVAQDACMAEQLRMNRASSRLAAR